MSSSPENNADSDNSIEQESDNDLRARDGTDDADTMSYSEEDSDRSDSRSNGERTSDGNLVLEAKDRDALPHKDLAHDADDAVDHVECLPVAEPVNLQQNLLTCFNCTMGYLPTKLVTETLIPCKALTNLWKTLPELSFHNEDFESVEKLLSYVNCLLLLRGDSRLKTFRLVTPVTGDARRFFSQIGSWVLYALKQRTEVLSVPISMRGAGGVVKAIFQNPYLVDICLDFDEDAPVEDLSLTGVSLPMLKMLRLSNIAIIDTVLAQIISGCPLLKELCFVNCILDANEIYCNTVEVLQIGCNPDSRTAKVLSSIVAPRVSHFTLSQDCTDMQYVTIDEMPLLRNAKVEVLDSKEVNSPSYFEESNGDIFTGIRATCYLELVGPSVPLLLKRDVGRGPHFPNLRILTLGGFCMFCSFDGIVLLLAACPNLRCIKIDVCFYCEEHLERKDVFWPRRIEGKFECSNLRIVEISGSDLHDEDVLVEVLKEYSVNGLANTEITYI